MNLTDRSQFQEVNRVLCLLELPGLALEWYLTQKPTLLLLFCTSPCIVIFAIVLEERGFSNSANSCLVSFAVLFSARAGSSAACFSRECLSKCVLCSVFMLKEERSKHVLAV